MTANLLLLDIRPGPPSPGIGMGEWIFVAVVVLMLTGAAIAGFVLLLRWLLRAKAPAMQTAAQPITRLQPNSPNQP